MGPKLLCKSGEGILDFNKKASFFLNKGVDGDHETWSFEVADNPDNFIWFHYISLL